MPRRTQSILFLTAFAVCLAMPAGAQDTDEGTATDGLRPEFGNVRAAGMGSAFVGGGTGTGAIYANPAGVVMSALYAFDVGYQRRQVGGLNAIGVSVVDAKTNPSVAAGAAYSFGFGENQGLVDQLEADEADDIDGRVRDHDFRGILAVPLVPARIALGVGVHYVNHRRGSWTTPGDGSGGTGGADDTSPNLDPTGTGTDESTDEEPSTDGVGHSLGYKGLSLDAGVMVTAGDNVSLGFSALNLLSIDGWGSGRTLNSGIGLYFGDLHLEGAWFAEQGTDDDKTFEHGGAIGLEYVIETFPIRVGFRQRGSDASYVAAGLGIRNTRAGGDLAFVQNVRTTDDRMFSLSVSAYF